MKIKQLSDKSDKLLGVLKLVKTQYPEARVKTDKGGMLIANSPSPVAKRLISLPKPPTSKG